MARHHAIIFRCRYASLLLAFSLMLFSLMFTSASKITPSATRHACYANDDAEQRFAARPRHRRFVHYALPFSRRTKRR
jgi:hypothetical protein